MHRHDWPVRIDVAVGLRVEVNARFSGGEPEQLGGQARRADKQRLPSRVWRNATAAEPSG